MSFAEGENDYLWRTPTYEKKLYQVGNRILRANSIQRKVVFKYSNDKEVNAYADGAVDVVTVEKGLLRYIENDDELAAILSHEIAHLINKDYRKAVWKKVAIGLTCMPLIVVDVAAGNKKPIYTTSAIKSATLATNRSNQGIELTADTTGIDLMVKAGYTPLAMTSVVEKISSDGSYVGLYFSTHPKGTVRIKTIENYISANYPEYLEPVASKDVHGVIESPNPGTYNRMLMPAN